MATITTAAEIIKPWTSGADPDFFISLKLVFRPMEASATTIRNLLIILEFLATLSGINPKLLLDSPLLRRYNIFTAFCRCISVYWQRAEGGKTMSEIRVKENESLDSALRRFKRSCAKAGVLSELRKREHYESPSVKRRKKSEAARAKRRKY